MKTNKLIIFTLVVLASISFTKCVEDGDFTVPQELLEAGEPTLTGSEVSFSSVKAKFSQSGGIVTYRDDEDVYISGYVISSDRTGNFFEEIMIQNTTGVEDLDNEPRTGLKVNIDVSDLNNTYNFGRKVFIKLAGLTVSEDSGIITIGKLDSNGEFTSISRTEYRDVILRSSETASITPKQVSLSNLNPNDLSTLIEIDNIQFSDTSKNLTFAGEENDQFNGERLLTSCIDGSSIILSTSTFSNFKSSLVPDGSGKITAVYGRNFFGDTDILVLNDPKDIVFDDNRCDLSQNLTPNLTIADLRGMYTGSNKVFPPESSFVVEGYVVSSDLRGNFFKNIYIQDKPENPTAAIQILADENNLYQSYPIGSKVIIKLDRLYLGEAFGGVLSLGYLDGDEVDRIDQGDLSKFLINTGIRETIVPKLFSLTSSGLTTNKLDDNGNTIDEDNDGNPDQETAPQGILVKLDNLQSPRSALGEAYAFYSGTSSANRIVESCETKATIILRNSGFSDFASQKFPEGKGSIVGVLSAFGTTRQLLVRDTNDVNLIGERCDPDFLECTGSTGSNTVVFSEDFENFDTFASEGWDIVNIDDKQTTWTEGSFSNNAYAQITAFSTADGDENVWLISPEVNLDNSTGEQLSLDIQTNFNNGEILTVWASTNYDGEDPTTATWQLLDVKIPIGSSSGFGDFEAVDPVNISCLDGTIHIGFLYSSSEDGATTRYHIDNFEILAD